MKARALSRCGERTMERPGGRQGGEVRRDHPGAGTVAVGVWRSKTC